MGAIQLPDELQRAIEQQAALRLLDDAEFEENDIRRAAESGIADIEAGRYVTVTTPEDGRLSDFS
jgi:predicted transcriptional regulator